MNLDAYDEFIDTLDIVTPEEEVEESIRQLRRARIEADALRLDALMMGRQPAVPKPDEVLTSLATAAYIQVATVIGLVLLLWGVWLILR